MVLDCGFALTDRARVSEDSQPDILVVHGIYKENGRLDGPDVVSEASKNHHPRVEVEVDQLEV